MLAMTIAQVIWILATIRLQSPWSW